MVRRQHKLKCKPPGVERLDSLCGLFKNLPGNFVWHIPVTQVTEAITIVIRPSLEYCFWCGSCLLQVDEIKGKKLFLADMLVVGAPLA
jgi:hypothetical protein